MIYLLADTTTWPVLAVSPDVSYTMSNGCTNLELAHHAIQTVIETPDIKSVMIGWNHFDEYAVPKNGVMMNARDPAMGKRMVQVYDKHFHDPVYNWVHFVNLVGLVHEFMVSEEVDCHMIFPDRVKRPQSLTTHDEKMMTETIDLSLIDGRLIHYPEDRTLGCIVGDIIDRT